MQGLFQWVGLAAQWKSFGEHEAGALNFLLWLLCEECKWEEKQTAEQEPKAMVLQGCDAGLGKMARDTYIRLCYSKIENRKQSGKDVPDKNCG